MYMIYVLQCENRALYTGITSNLSRRMQQHLGPRPGGAKYTRSHTPTALVQLWETESHHAAARFEYAFKRLSRHRKLALLQNPAQWQSFFPSLCAERYTPLVPLPMAAYLSDTHDTYDRR